MLLKPPSPTIQTDLVELSVPPREQLYRLEIKVTTAANATTTWNIRHPQHSSTVPDLLANLSLPDLKCYRLPACGRGRSVWSFCYRRVEK